VSSGADFAIGEFGISANPLTLRAGIGSYAETKTITTGAINAYFPLGSTFFIKLLQPDSTGNLTAVESSFSLEAATISPNTGGASLFATSAVIEFNPAASDVSKSFEAVHLGSVILDIDPVDTSIPSVEVTIVINTPASLGNAPNTFDAGLITLGHSRGIPPHILKGDVRQEAGPNFNPKAYRYEPLSVDCPLISGGQNLRTKPPYSLYRLATSNGLAQGTDILTDDISPRSIYYIVVTAPCSSQCVTACDTTTQKCNIRRLISDTDQLVPALAIFQANDATQRWSYWSPKRSSACLTFTAQTPLAASFGLLQLLYSTAQGYGWAGINGHRNPSYLFDTPSNLAAGGGSLDPASGYLRRQYLTANPTVSQTAPHFNGVSDFTNAWVRALNDYNHSSPTCPPPPTPCYGTSVLNFSGRYTPVRSSNIFP
jgi:hypothetical protein